MYIKSTETKTIKILVNFCEGPDPLALAGSTPTSLTNLFSFSSKASGILQSLKSYKKLCYVFLACSNSNVNVT